MAQPVQKQLSPYKNENLFSRHYLKKVIQRTSIWEVDEDEIEEAFEELEDIYNEQKDLLPHRTDDEEEVRNEFITPILRRVLEFKKEQEKKSGNSQRIPDYALYDNIEKKKKAVESQEYYKHAIGLVEAKAWEKDLEKKTSTGDMSTDDSNPTKQIVDYLIENDPQWGVLTNGKKWRLVHREASNRLDTYYEVDIENLLTSERPREERLEEFKYFYIFFRKQAFQGDEGDKILDEILEESLQYAEDIGEDLEENIYQALEWIAKGYLNNSQNDGIEDEPIEKIHDNALILLYRLLFAHYADARDILGDPSGPYEERYNFSSFVDRVCKEIDEGSGYGNGGLLGPNLWEIFSLIDKGSKAKGIPEDEFEIPAYNGGLFKQENHPFFQKYNLHDEYLAKVIDLVARTDRGEEDGKSRVDYYDLSVRHLGGIYEGLLEYQLEKADEDMVEIKENGDLQVKPIREAEEDGDSFSDDDIIEEGQPYLVTDDGERKATGSYYTPDYIVSYIVKNTVGPKLEEEIEDLESDEEKAEAILDMQILDPAMGSAHFLVEVIDYIAKELVDYKSIEIDQAKREVARQCVYGVDVNPLATELGKLSIWLKTISEDKPLSFLDHHIKTGNSLIGADIHDINRHPEEDEDSERQVTIGEEFGEENAGVVRANVQEMLKKFKEIQEKQADSPEDIKEQEELYREFLDFPFRKRFDVLADVYTSHYFENNYKVDDYNRLLQAFKLSEQKEEGDEEEWGLIVEEDWVQKATDSSDRDERYKDENLSNQKGFFHWKLEFPEVFFDIEEGVEKQDSGFDALVGNPPWGAKIEDFQNIIDENYGNISKENGDSYEIFMELGENILENDGKLGFIVPNTLLIRQGHSHTRSFLLNETQLDYIVDLGEDIFEDVTMPSCIVIFKSNSSKKDWKMNCRDLSNIDRDNVPEKLMNNETYNKVDQNYFKELRNNSFLVRPSETELNLLNKLRREDNLSKYLDYLGEGIKTGGNKIFLSKEPFDCEDIVQNKSVKGRDIQKYGIKSKRYLLNSNKVNKKQHPKAWKYLSSNKEDLSKRAPVKKEEINWYELNENRVEKTSISPKIIIRETEDEIIASPDYEGLTAIKTTFVLKPKDENISYLTGILNSKLIEKYYYLITAERDRSFARVRASDVKSIPVRMNNSVDIDNKVEDIYSIRENFRSEKNSFLDWLEADWDVKVDDLSLKTHLREYWEYDFDEFMRIAKKNKSQIDGNVKSREFRELMKDEWENSMLTLEPLMDKINRLENEIDAIVFDLYDLTEEEVETVLDSLDTPEGEKASIMEKFREVSN